MFKYKVQAYDDTQYGPVHEMLVVVTASTEAQAIELAKKVVERTNYAIIEIEVLELKKRG